MGLFPGEIVYFGDRQPHATCNLEKFTLGIGGQGHIENWPPLIQASYKGDVTAAYEAAGATEIDAVISSGRLAGQTAIQRAAQMGNVDIVAFLLGKRVDTNLGTMDILHAAVDMGHIAVVKLLTQKAGYVAVEQSPMIHVAASKGHVDVMELLVNFRANAA